MKANAWNKSRITPPITNFLVLMFSIMAPAMAKERLAAGGGRENVTPSEEQSVTRWRNVASAAGGEASWTPPFSAALLLPLNFQGGGKKKQESHDWEGLGFIPERPTQDREQSAERCRVKIEARVRVAAPLWCRSI